METAFTTILVALITAIFGPVIVEWVKSLLSKKESKISSVKEAIDIIQWLIIN